MRPIQPDDAPRLRAFMRALSSESVTLRFFAPRRELSWPEAIRFAPVDRHGRDALVAWVPGPDGDRIVAVVRYDQVQPDTVEAAIVVLDAYQRRGLGVALFRRLVRLVRRRGFRFLRAAVLAANGRAMRLLFTAGYAAEVASDRETRWVQLDLHRPTVARESGVGR